MNATPRKSYLSGVYIFRGRATVVDNTISNEGNGVTVVEPSSDTLVARNRLTDNGSGVYLANATGVTVKRNVARGEGAGFVATGSAGNIFTRNKAFNHPPYVGCYDTSVGSGTAATANVWTRNIGTLMYPAGICTR